MADEELQIVRLRDDFYRDGFVKVTFALFSLGSAVSLLAGLLVYFFFYAPPPIMFRTGADWRLLPEVALDQPYLKESDLLQWVSERAPNLFTIDFVSYDTELQAKKAIFTDHGWGKFQTLIAQYAGSDALQKNKSFANGSAASAPIIYNQGLLNGNYTWEVHMPVNLKYVTGDSANTVPLLVEMWVTRIPTSLHIDGVAIDDISVLPGKGDQVVTSTH